MGQVHLKALGLDEVLDRSRAVVVARPDGHSRARLRLGRGVPEFVRVDDRFEIVEVLADTTGALAAGRKIRVHPADAVTRLRVHGDYHARGLSRHWNTPRYDPRNAPEDGDDVILFMRAGDEGKGWPPWAYAIAGAVEGLGSLTSVRSALVTRPLRDGVIRDAEPEPEPPKPVPPPPPARRMSARRLAMRRMGLRKTKTRATPTKGRATPTHRKPTRSRRSR